MREITYTISNIAGGDERRFRTTQGEPSDASIRHARRQGSMGFICSDPDVYDRIAEYLDQASLGESL